MARKSKKTKAKQIAMRAVKKPKRAPAKRAEQKKAAPKAAVSPLEEMPFMLGYAFYRTW